MGGHTVDKTLCKTISTHLTREYKTLNPYYTYQPYVNPSAVVILCSTSF